jgi:hypothetical protein
MCTSPVLTPNCVHQLSAHHNVYVICQYTKMCTSPNIISTCVHHLAAHFSLSTKIICTNYNITWHSCQKTSPLRMLLFRKVSNDYNLLAVPCFTWTVYWVFLCCFTLIIFNSENVLLQLSSVFTVFKYSIFNKF